MAGGRNLPHHSHLARVHSFVPRARDGRLLVITDIVGCRVVECSSAPPVKAFGRALADAAEYHDESHDQTLGMNFSTGNQVPSTVSGHGIASS